jgi:oligopeptide transport system permease protein
LNIAWAAPRISLFVSLLLKVALSGGSPLPSGKPASVVENLTRQFHLDEPVWKQYVLYMGNFLRGDLGPSYQYRGQSVSEIVFGAGPGEPPWNSRFGRSLQLGLLAFAFACLVGLPIGVVSAVRQNSWLDHVAQVAATAGVGVPGFVVALFLMVVFGVQLGWLPVVTADYGDWRAWVLPAFTLALPLLAFLARLTRASMLESLRQDYVRTARAKGLRWRTVVVRHALRNSLIPVATVLGPALASLTTGSFIVEYMFSFPGMGQFFVQGVGARDYSLVMGLTLFYALVIMLANLFVDALYVLLDPRIRVS